jgi:hypothetical protein
MVKAGYWNASALISELAQATLDTLPPPADRVLYLIGDKTISGKTGKKQPLASYSRMNNYQQFTFGISLVLLIAQWGSFRLPVAAAVLDPKKKGDQNIQFRRMLRQFDPPSWAREVIVIADAGFASKDNLRLIIRKQWHYVFAISRTWRLTDGTHLRDLARHLPKSCYRRVASYKPDRRRKDYWVFTRRARLKTLGDVTILLSKQRRNDGPKKIKLIVTNLDDPSASEILNIYARRWAVEGRCKSLERRCESATPCFCQCSLTCSSFDFTGANSKPTKASVCSLSNIALWKTLSKNGSIVLNTNGARNSIN